MRFVELLEYYRRELSYLSKIVQWAEDVKVCAPFPSGSNVSK
jgi:hypothetical protein